MTISEYEVQCNYCGDIVPVGASVPVKGGMVKPDTHKCDCCIDKES